MICGKEKPESDLSGRICRPCAEGVKSEAAGAQVRGKRDADKAVRQTGQTPPAAPTKKPD
jgi:hypothetical protein